MEQQRDVLKSVMLGDAVETIIDRVDVPQRTVLFAPLPKTGSSYFSRVLCCYLDLAIRQFSYASGRSEHRLFPPAVLMRSTMRENVLAYVHTPASTDTVNLIQLFDIDVIVQVRRLGDIVVSMRDHVLNQSGAIEPWLLGSINQYEFERWGGTKQLDVIIDLFLPRVIDMYTSWWLYTQHAIKPPLWLSYEFWVGDALGVLREISTYFGIEYNHPKAKQVLRYVDERLPGEFRRYNKGIVGRGAATLNKRQHKQIEKLASYFPSVDFSGVL